MLSFFVLGFLSSVGAVDPRLFYRDIPPSASLQCFDPSSQPMNQDNFDCPAKNPHYIQLNPDGSCGTLKPDNSGGAPCSNYCEVRIYWSYGPEQPFDVGCQATDNKCSITSTTGTSVTNTHTFNVGFSLGKRDTGDPASALDRIKGSFNFGASWSWSDTTSQATASTNNKPENAYGQCGHWVFIPWYVTSCGSLTWADYTPTTTFVTAGGTNIFTNPSCGTPKTVGNFCQTTPYTDSNGKAQGETVFVATDCNNNKPLAFCYQQTPYLQIGVANTPDMFIDYLFAHGDEGVTNRDISGPPLTIPVNMCLKDQWNGPFHQDPNWKDDGIGHARPKPLQPTPGAQPQVS